VLLCACPAGAATFTVTNGNDSGTGSLRQAVTDANTNVNNPTVDEIQITHIGTIDLLDQISITTPMTITGPGADSLNVRRSPAAVDPFHFFGVTFTATPTVTFEGMMISGARDDSNGGVLFKAGAGSLVLDSVWLSDNQTTASGGAIHCDGGALSIRNSTLSANQANFAGGISVNSNIGAGTACVADVVNSTITGNSATEFGGGVYVGGTGQATLNSNTIQGNTADFDNAGGGGGGGTYKASAQATITVANTLYAGNMVGTSGGGTTTQCGGAHTSSGYNLRTVLEAGCTGFIAPTDVVNGSPMLGSLSDNGGPTPTIPLLEGSPAINAGNPATPADNAFPACPAEDQRTATRGGGNGVCDIGAFEWQHPTTTTVACAPTSVTLGAGSSTCTATVTDTAASPTPTTTPTLSVNFAADGAGSFSDFGSCTLSEVTLGEASCQVTYTASAVGSGSHQITGSYGGDVGHDPSQSSTFVGVVPPPTGPTAVPTGQRAVAIKKCKKRFPKGPKRKKCIKRAKRLPV